MRLYYCNTIYKTEPPSDINPLILQKYRDGRVLVLCARDGQKARIQRQKLIGITAFGWWDPQVQGKAINFSAYNAVVILDKKRIDASYQDLLEYVEGTCRERSPLYI